MSHYYGCLQIPLIQEKVYEYKKKIYDALQIKNNYFELFTCQKFVVIKY